MSEKGRILYSSDGSGVNLVEKNKTPASYADVVPSQTILKLRIEKNGRGGKSVTVIYNLPNNPPFFKELTKKLKNHCGTGGSFKDSTIEIQGDQMNKIREYLKGLSYQVKG
ncbi:translation initiation factor [Bacteriovorax sp. Seq25_V]|uniref:translation initiation factor n=1 Tax=Bacteriovorax sp. Seq25_V TaxID=1201288 RepID=UPI00038A4C8D|nr:translation initiation factor [Bacteriovorax sp. Seq25_V]EQC45269.1 putative translation initiation factor SUI1 [Bacteriovorax sp. Seq25_V]